MKPEIPTGRTYAEGQAGVGDRRGVEGLGAGTSLVHSDPSIFTHDLEGNTDI